MADMGACAQVCGHVRVLCKRAWARARSARTHAWACHQPVSCYYAHLSAGVEVYIHRCIYVYMYVYVNMNVCVCVLLLLLLLFLLVLMCVCVCVCSVCVCSVCVCGQVTRTHSGQPPRSLHH